MHNRLALIVLATISLLPITLSGQKQVNSPFARYNLGILEPAGPFRNSGMGGTGMAVRDNNSIFFHNPASYSSLDTNSFIFDFGVDYGLNLISNDSLMRRSGDLNFDHLLMGFPVARGLGVAIGLYNVSNGYYKISESVTKSDPDYNPLTGEYTAIHYGSGGLTNFFIGSGINLSKFLSAGINMTVLFGTIQKSNQLSFFDSYHVYHDNITSKLQLSGVNFDYGMQLFVPLKKDYYINAGASLTSGKYFRSDFENIGVRFTTYGGTDTLLTITDDSTKAFLPGTLRMGVAFGKKNKFTGGIDYIMTNWSNAKFHGSEDFVNNTRALLFGIEYIPDKYSNYSFARRMEYRLGGHIEDNYLVIKGSQVKEFGMSLGLGIPMRMLSKTNLFIDFTRKTYTGSGFSHFENYFTMGASLNRYDLWFIKRKYD
jgi:hypothetical protein